MVSSTHSDGWMHICVAVAGVAGGGVYWWALVRVALSFQASLSIKSIKAVTVTGFVSSPIDRDT